MAFSCELMEDPVVAADGFTYERAAITEWIASHSTSPTTNQSMVSKILFPNLSLRSQIVAWKEENRLPRGVACNVPADTSSSFACSAGQPSASTSQLPPSVVTCPTHALEPLRAFCVSCKKSICSDCAVDSTLCKNHVTRSLSSIIAQLRAEHSRWQQILPELPNHHQVSFVVFFRLCCCLLLFVSL
jgi:hypothetical protein